MFSERFFTSTVTTSESVKGYKYTVIVSDVTFRNRHAITEIFIPSLGLCFNSEYYVFSTDKPRDGHEPLIEINISKVHADKIQRIYAIQQGSTKIKEELKSDDTFGSLLSHTPDKKDVPDKKDPIMSLDDLLYPNAI